MEAVNVTVRMERQMRDDAASLFSELGVSTTQAINMFLKQAVREQGIPFEVAARPALGHRAESPEEPAYRIDRRVFGTLSPLSG